MTKNDGWSQIKNSESDSIGLKGNIDIPSYFVSLKVTLRLNMNTNFRPGRDKEFSLNTDIRNKILQTVNLTTRIK